jgi:hypothetical protein
MPYPAILTEVVRLLEEPPLRGACVVADQTAVGKALTDRLRQALLLSRLVRVTLTAGHALTFDESGACLLPKKDLVTCLQLLLQDRRVKVSRTLPEADELTRELASFKAKVSLSVAAGDLSWREGPRDDLVLAVALACWQAEREPPWPGEPFTFGDESLISRAPKGVFLS